MKFALATIFCLLTSAAVAQVIGDGMGSPYGGSKAAVTYTGPGDVVSGATAWYGLRAYSSAQIGGTQKAVNLRRASDNTTCDFDINTSGNLGGTDSGCGTGVGLSLAAFATQDATCTGTIASTTLTCASASSTPHTGSTLTGAGLTQPSYIVSCGTFTGGAGTCTLNVAQTVSVGETITMTYGLFVTEAYDQTGNGSNATQATAGSQLQLLPTCISAKPCMNGVSSATQYLQGTIASITQPYSYSAVTERTGNTSSFGGIISNRSSAGTSTYFNNSTNSVSGFGGASVTATASDLSLHAIQFIVNGASSAINVDGTNTTGNFGTQTGSTTISFGVDSTFATPHYITGYLGEGGDWPIAFNSTQYGNLCHNQFLYWGTSTSC